MNPRNISVLLLVKKLPAIVILFFIPISLNAQINQNCIQALRNVERAYNEGRIAEIPAIVSNCLKNGFTKEQKIRAYRFLILSYLYQYETGSAENAMLELLRIDPEYKPTAEEPTPFKKLYQQFRTHPIYLIGARTGLNLTLPFPIDGYSIDQNNFGKYRSGLGFNIGPSIDFYLSEKWNANLSILFQRNLHKQAFSQVLGFQNMTLIERQSLVNLSILARYKIKEWDNLRLYLNAGGSLNYLLNAQLTDENRSIKRGNTPVTPPAQNPDFTSLRKTLNYQLTGGGILITRVGRSYFSLSINYSIGLNNVVAPEKRYSNASLAFESLYVDNDFSINNLMVSAAYLIPVYKPKLVKK
jgi:hypothetical protein